MNQLYCIKILHSNYCRIVFVLSFIGAYYLIPENVFHSNNRLVAIIFMLVFALTITCIVRNTKEKIKTAKTYKSSILGILATVLGVSALQVCGMSSMCVVGVGAGVLSVLLPSFMMTFLENFGLQLLYFSIFIQLISLYYMKCFSGIETHSRKLSDSEKIDLK